VLKTRSARADDRCMGPGGWFHGRRRTPAALIAVLAGLAIVVGGGAASAASAGRPAPPAGSGALDTSIPQTPIVYPSSLRSVIAMTPKIRFSDLGASDAWAKDAIRWVAATNSWMRDFAANPDGTYPFRPHAIESRKYLARAVVKAFAPSEVPDASIVFPDLDSSSSWYRFAAIAVKHGWMGTRRGGAFAPDDGVTMAELHRALVIPLGLKPAAVALNHLHTHSGQTFAIPRTFGTTLLGMRLYLRYNAPTGAEAMDVDPHDLMSRAQVAYSLFRATTQPSWTVPDLLTQYANVELPHLGPRMMNVVQWGIRYNGYPYIWGGEWGLASQEPSALGGQPRAGFDCSGFSWWLLRADDGGAWNVVPPRPYAGWSLPQRTSASMAANASAKIRFADLRPGDLMFYDGDGDRVVDHVDTYVGHGYALDSSSTPGGVTIMWVGDGWYRDHFTFGRQILPG
jgi:hypothetical protein